MPESIATCNKDGTYTNDEGATTTQEGWELGSACDFDLGEGACMDQIGRAHV